tara:strand:+ start:290 stop:487 length:198 start_codon:yes stop_codon:yes gene_type:complete
MTKYTSNELIYWSSQSIKDELLFDKILDIQDDINDFLEKHNLNIKIDKELFLMHLLLFIYENSLS